MRVAIYARVSSDRRHRGRSVEQQEAECRAFAAQQGWEVVRIFVDNDRSASRFSTKDRPQFIELSRFLRTGNADVLLTWEASRPSRDMVTFLPLRELCRELGVRYGYGERVYDLSDPDDLERVTTDMAKAEAESGRTSKRVKRDVRANAAAGRPHGRHLYGYARQYHPETRELVAVVEKPEEAAIVREAARRVLVGEPLFAIRRDFIDRGVPAPGRADWDLTQIRRLLRNPGYTGKRTHQGKVVADAVWPPLLAEDDFRALQVILSDPARRSTMRQGELRHLASYIGSCGVCGAHACGRNNRQTPVYGCSAGSHLSRPRGQWRGWPDRPEEWTDRFDGVDDVITCAVVERLGRPDAVDLLTADPDADERAAVTELQALRRRLDDHIDQAARGDLSAYALARVEQQLLPQIEAAEQRARPRHLPPVVGDLVGAADVAARWGELTVAERRVVVASLLTVTLMPAGKGNRRSFDPATVKIEWKGQS